MKTNGIFEFRGENEIVITCEFDAPRKLVFDTVTDPGLVPEWWGPARFETTVDKMDVRPGGEWRYVQRDRDGNEFAFSGVYSEVTPPERIVYTFNFEPMPGHEVLETLTFEEKDGKTKFTDTLLYQSSEDREGMASSGMEEGVTETMERMAALLKKRSKRG